MKFTITAFAIPAILAIFLGIAANISYKSSVPLPEYSIKDAIETPPAMCQRADLYSMASTWGSDKGIENIYGMNLNGQIVPIAALYHYDGKAKCRKMGIPYPG